MHCSLRSLIKDPIALAVILASAAFVSILGGIAGEAPVESTAAT